MTLVITFPNVIRFGGDAPNLLKVKNISFEKYPILFLKLISSIA